MFSHCQELFLKNVKKLKGNPPDARQSRTRGQATEYTDKNQRESAFDVKSAARQAEKRKKDIKREKKENRKEVYRSRERRLCGARIWY